MNKIYRLIWSKSRQMWMAVSEKVAAGWYGRTLTVGALVLAGLLAAGGTARALDHNALPAGGQIVAGRGCIAQSGSALTVTQQTDRMIANWNSFNIGQNAAVTFQQPGASSVALNRILDQNPSQIFGSLTANGQVFLLNPAGIYFGPTARVDVGGLVASSLNLSNENFLNGSYRFEKAGGAGAITNQGQIRTADGGYIAFLSPRITNSGTLAAPGGTVALAAGDKVSLDFTGDKLVSFTVEQGAIDALIENKGLIKADGGMVMLTAQAANSLATLVVNNEGVIEANTLAEKNGRIVLDGGDVGITRSTGAISAKGDHPGETGGSVTLTGDKVGLFGAASVDVSGEAGGGTVLIGGGFQGKDATIANAKKTIVDTDAVIRANAGTTGNGGEVVVWADDTARYYGSIEAKGGALSGNGGNVEVSGKGWLDFQGRVNTTAAQGQGGSLLLDPTNIIVATADPGGGAVTRSLATDLDAATDNPAETSWITPATLVGLLNTANVNFQAYNDITVANAVDATANAGDFGLSMTAGRSILINDNITLRGAFAAYANSTGWAGFNRGAGAGDFTMAPGTNIVSSADTTGITISVGTQNPAGTATIEGLRSTGISGAVSANINVYADSTDLRGGADSIVSTRYVTLRPTTTTRPILVGAAGDGSQFSLTAAELATVKDTGASLRINIGDTGQTGGITLSGPLSFNNEVWLYNTGAGGAITFDGTAQVATNGNNLGLFAGTGDAGAITQANGATISTGAGGLYGYADSIALNGAANSISGTGSRTFYQNTASRPMLIGAAGTASDFALDATELGTLASGYSSLTFGSQFTGGTGGATLSGPLSFSAPVTIYNWGAGGSVTVNGTPTVSGALAFGASGKAAPVVLNASVAATSGVSFSGAVTAGADNLTVDAGTGTATFSSTVDHGANAFTVTADNVALSGNWTGTGARTLQPTTVGQTIGLAGAGNFNLTAAELGYLSNDSPASVTIGRSNGTGAITGGAFSFDDSLALRGGAITQTGAWTLGSTASFAAGTGNNITLTQAGNDFGGAVTVVSGKNVSLRDTSALTIGTSTVTGNLTLQTGGALTQSGDLAVTGTTTITAGANDVTLDRSGNNFTGAVSIVSGNNVSLQDTNALALGASTVGGNLTLQTGGALTQSGNLVVAGTTSLTAGANDITLASAGNDFGGAVTVASGKNVSIKDANSLTFGGVSTVSGTLTLTSTSFTQDAAATIAGGDGNITITADTIALNGAPNSISGTGYVTLAPKTPSRPVVIGAVGGAGDFALESTEIATLKDGFSGIQLGPSSVGSGGVTLYGPLSFYDRLTIANTGGQITLAATAAIDTHGNDVFFYAGSGDNGAFTQTTGASINARHIETSADKVTLLGAPNSINSTGNITFYPTTPARPIYIGEEDAAGRLAFNADEISTLKAGGNPYGIIFGRWNGSTGGIFIDAPMSFNNNLFFDQKSTGSITANATPTVTGSLSFVSAPVTLNASVNATAGVSFDGAVTVGADNLTVNAGTGTATFSSTLAHGANNFTVTADDVALSGNWTGSGKRTLQPATTTQTIGLAGGAGTFALSATELGYLKNDTPASVTIGRANGTGAISGGAFSFDDPLVLCGGAITQTGDWTLSNTLSLQSGAGNNITLDRAGNDFGGAVSFASAKNIALSDSNALTLGAINATGTVDIATLTGDLTVTGAVATTNASVDAIKLNAGKSTAAGTATGGNIIISGSPTISTGAGGRATLFTGGVSGSTGLTALVGSGSGRFRYNSDEAATNYTTALGTGSYAIYREQSTITTTANDASKTYDGLAYSGSNGVTTAGFVNGDTSAILGGALAYGGTSQGAVNAGSYAITPGGYSNGLGYGLAYADGTLEITGRREETRTSQDGRSENINADLTSSQKGVNGTGQNQDTGPGAPSTPTMGPGAGSTTLAGLATAPLVTLPPPGTGNLVLSASTFSTPVTMSASGASVTLALGFTGAMEKSAEICTLPVFAQQGSGPVSSQGQFVMSESGNALCLTQTTEAVTMVPPVVTGGAASAPFALSLENGMTQQLRVGVTAEGVLVVTTPASGGTVDVRQAILMGTQVARQELHLDLKNMTSAVFVEL